MLIVTWEQQTPKTTLNLHYLKQFCLSLCFSSTDFVTPASCILHPWGIKIFKDTEKLTACMLWDATIDGSENFFRGMPCLRDLKYVLKASYLQTKEQFCLLIKQVKNNFWTNRQKYLHAIFLLKAAMLIWLVIRQSFLLTDCAKL